MLFLLLGGFSMLALLAVLGFVGYVIGIADEAPSLSSLKPVDKGAVSEVFAANGQLLGTIEGDNLRIPVRATDMPQYLRDATVAIEDQRFYQHKGVDFEGILRAAWKDVTTGQALQAPPLLRLGDAICRRLSQRRAPSARRIRDCETPGPNPAHRNARPNSRKASRRARTAGPARLAPRWNCAVAQTDRAPAAPAGRHRA